MKEKLVYSVVCETGKVRSMNQDRILIQIGQLGKKEFGLFAVADGMGGHAHGEVASTMAIAGLLGWWNSELEDILRGQEAPWYRVLSSLEACFHKINEEIRTASSEVMGTTLTVLFLYGDKLVVMHIGDSRIYRITPKEIRQMTKDHTVASLNDIGSKGSYHHMLTQCLGIQEHVYPDAFIDTYHHKDSFILCTDGLYNYIPMQSMEHIMKEYRGAKETFDSMVTHLYKEVLHHGAGDNVSILGVQARKGRT